MGLKPGYKQTEAGVIPEDWEVCPVGQKGEVVTGKALAVNGQGKQRPYLRTKNVFDGRIDINDVLTMPMTEDQFAQFRLRHGDVLLNEGQSLELVGRCAMYQDEYPEPCAIQNQLLRFRARDGVSGVFASYLFRYCQQTGVFARIALQTTSIAHLGGSRFEQLLLAWPKSKLEQEAIAEALSDADALIEFLEKLSAKKRYVKQGAMQQLLTGKRRLNGFSNTAISYKQSEVGVIPEDWEVSTVGAEFSIQLGKMLDSEKNIGVPKPYIGNRAVQWGGIDLNDVGFIKMTPSDLQRYRLRGGDLLVCEGGEIGRAAIWREQVPECYYQKALHRLRSKGNYNVPLMLYMLERWNATGFLTNFVTQTSIPHLPKDKLERVTLPVPTTKDEQVAIVAVLSDMDAEIAALDDKLDKARRLKQGMMHNLLTGSIRLV